MFCSRNANTHINKIQDRSLRLITNDKTSTLEHPLQASNEITTRQGNLQVLMIEVFKIINACTTKCRISFYALKTLIIFGTFK